MSGEWRASDGDSVVRVFGADATRGMFNPLRVTRFSPAHFIAQHKLGRPGILHSPIMSPEAVVYEQAEHELGEVACGSDKKIKPAWLLRKMIEAKMSSGKTPDWRVASISAVDTSCAFTVKFAKKTGRVDGAACTELTVITISFMWNARSRTHPGRTYMKPNDEGALPFG